MWQSEMPRVLRFMLLDIAEPPTYSDNRLAEVIVVAGQLIRNEMAFSQNFVADVGAITITPDPTFTDPNNAGNNTRDDSYINLTCMKAACIIERGEVRASIGQAIAIRDGSSSIDLRNVANAKIKLLEKGGFCMAFEEMKFQYLAGQVRTAGAAIMSPFRVFAGYSDTGFYPSQYDRTAYFR